MRMQPSSELSAIASQIQTAQETGCQIEPFTARLPGFDVPTAYAVAELVHQSRLRQGARPVGRKIGFTNPDMWAIYGVREPIWSYIYDTTVVHGRDAPLHCQLDRYTEPKIEPEIVFHFRRAPAPDMKPVAVLDCIDWVAHGFEIVQSHFPGWKFRAADTVADAALHGTLLVGAPQSVARLGPDLIDALQTFSLKLLCDGRLREVGVGANVLGSPLQAISHLVAVLAQQPHHPPLQGGEWVTTGTITTAQPVHAGETWQTEVQGIALPGLAVKFHAGPDPR